MTNFNRRGLLGSAALGASGLMALANAAQAANPGDGGMARNAVPLTGGDSVVHHDQSDTEALPEVRFQLDGSRPKVTSGGWAKEATVHQFPISKGIAGVHMFLDPGASRELHWHAIAAEWAFVIDGRCQTVVLDPSGASEINNYEPGDSGTSPRATATPPSPSATSPATSSCPSTTAPSPSTAPSRSPTG